MFQKGPYPAPFEGYSAKVSSNGHIHWSHCSEDGLYERGVGRPSVQKRVESSCKETYALLLLSKGPIKPKVKKWGLS